jgi:hypothetical protein
MHVSQFSSKKENIMLHIKKTVKDCQSINCCNFLKHRLVKEDFLFIIDFMVPLCNYEQTRLSLKSLYAVPAFKKETQGCLPILERLVSSVNYFEIMMKVIKKKKVCKITSLIKTGIFSVTPLF